jgi:hypothetical protein
MKMGRCAVVALTAALGVAGTALAEDDDWEFQEDAAQGVSVAAVRYDAGQMIVVQCRRGGLTVVLTGLPPSSEPLSMTATRSDGRRVNQTWVSAGAPGAFRSVSPGRDARLMRGGGAYAVQTAEGASHAVRATFDLPTQSASLDRVLNACGWALEDDRDLLAEAGEIRLDRPTWRNRRERARPPTPPRGLAEHEVSCIVSEMRLQQCRADHPPSATVSHVESLLRTVEGREVYVEEGVDPLATEGKVFHAEASNQLLIVANR